ncbi:DUF2325 domain-containing protein [Methyloprofundus sp.]|uniref:DUF2325 domain-containing protein n=1 Tax=Methyloprofundus sp. TaxID=2020875 RepID=UPI003D0FE5C6
MLIAQCVSNNNMDGVNTNTSSSSSVLYVKGDKINLTPFYRELVEEHAGTFMHHDGGIEKNTQDLQYSLSKADVIVFPSSCISHDAYWKIKQTCKK